MAVGNKTTAGREGACAVPGRSRNGGLVTGWPRPPGVMPGKEGSMKKLALLAAFGLAVLLAAPSAWAQSPCCAEATDGSSCNDNTGSTGGQTAGCVQAPTGSCAGGDATVPSGCICLAGSGTCVDSTGPISDQACTDAAAAACCAAGEGTNCP